MKTKLYSKESEFSRGRNSFIRKIAFLLCCLCFGIGASAQTTYVDQNGIRYTLPDGGNGVMVTGTAGSPQSPVIVILDTVIINGIGLPVVGITDNALNVSTHSNTTSLTLPAGITSIGAGAFATWNILSEITFLGTSEPQIMPGAFFEIARTIYVPNATSGFTASNWGANATIVYGENGGTISHQVIFFQYNGDDGTPVQTIETAADDQLLKRPADPTRSGYTFDGWYTSPNFTATTLFNFNATKVTGPFTLYAKWTAVEQGTMYTDENNILYEAKSNGATVIGHATNNASGSLVIPQHIPINGINCPVVNIKEYAFANSSITSLTLPASVTLIEQYAFSNCFQLTSITYLGTTEPEIANYAFVASSETEGPPTRILNLPNAASGFEAGYWSENLTIEYGLEVVYHEVIFFNHNSDDGTPIQDTVYAENDRLLFQPNQPYRSGYTFNGWYTSPNFTATTLFNFNATKVTGPFTLYAKWTAVEQGTTYTDGNGVLYEIKSSGAIVTGHINNTFTGSLVIPASVPINGANCPVVKIQNQAFANYYSITSLTLPASVQTIESKAFYACNGLTSITCLGSREPQIEQEAFADVDATGNSLNLARTLNVPNASSGFTAANWGSNVTIIYGTGANLHQVTFLHYINENNVNVQEIVTVEDDHLLTKPVNPTRQGYTFDGWYTSYNYTALFNFETTKVFNSFTLYAKWTETAQNPTYIDDYNIKYEITTRGAVIIGMTGAPGSTEIIIPETVLVNDVNYPVREIADHALATSVYGNVTSLTLPANLNYVGTQAFGGWIKLTSITYNGTTEPQILPRAFDATATGASPARVLNVPNASSGFTASNWGENVTINYGLTATSHEVTFVITLTDDGEYGEANVILVEDDDLLTKPADPVRPGYTFGGWYTTMNYTTAFDFGTTKVTSALTLYAKWTVSDGTFAANGILYKPLSSAQAEVIGYTADNSPVSLTIPARVINGSISYQVMGVADSAFFQCLTLKKATISEGITYVKGAAFAASGITEITFPASLLTIGTGAYSMCTNLSSVTFLGTATPINMVGNAGGNKGNVIRTLYAPNATSGLDAEMWDVDAIIYGGEPPVVEERTENSAVVTWAFVENATLYTLYLYSDASKETLLNSYLFDANGNLIEHLRSSLANDRAIFDIDELDGDKSYYIEVKAESESGDILATQSSEIPTLRNFETSIKTPISTSETLIYAANGYVIIENLPTNEPYAIYSVSGMQLFGSTSSNSDAIKLPVAMGIYIVKTTGNTVKVIAK